MPVDEKQASEAIARIDDLVHKAESLQDPSARAVAVDLAQAVLSLHATALHRMLEVVSSGGAAGAEAIAAMASDDLVSSVFVLHGLHPDDVETRVRRAFEKLRHHFDSRGAGIALLDLDSKTVHLRFTGSRPGAGPAARQVIEDAICEAAPEILNIVIEGVEEVRPSGFVPLTDLMSIARA